MARTKKRTIITDTDGKQYHFDNSTFFRINRERINKDQHVTLGQVRNRIADACGVTADNVRNWETGANYFGDDIGMVKKIAGVLEVDYKELLIPIEKEAMISMKTEVLIDAAADPTMVLKNRKAAANAELISKVFEECVSIFYEAQASEKKIKQIFTFERIRPIRLYIDQQTLKVDDAIRYRLHGTLIKMVEMFENGYLPDEWCDLTTYDYPHELWYIDARAREQHMRDGIEARIYLMDEIDLADALGLDVTEPTEEEWDALDDMDIDDISKRFGADESYRNSVMSISTLGLDILIKITRDIFSALFSDYYEDPVSTLN